MMRYAEIEELVALAREQKPGDESYAFSLLMSGAACVAIEADYTPEQFKKALEVLEKWYRKQHTLDAH